MFPILRPGRKNDPKAVKDAQYLLKGHNRFKTVFYAGAVDGIYGPNTAAGVFKAKYWTGYPKHALDHAFGPQIYSYLLPLTSSEAVKLPLAYRTRRLLRIAAERRRAESYQNPYRAVSDLHFLGYDQGVDFGGSGPVYAIGPAQITVVTTTSGWPGGGGVGYTLLHGSHAGYCVYFVENITPVVKSGQIVNSNTVIAYCHDAYPYTESGWAHPVSLDPIAPLYPDPHSPKQAGYDFGNFLKNLGTPYL